MKAFGVLLLGAYFALSSVAVAGTQWSEELLKGKTGRYSQAEEARRKALSDSARQSSKECCLQPECCGQQQKTVTADKPKSTKPNKRTAHAD